MGLKSRDGDIIDAMFIDRRRYGEAPHKLLIIFSGNCDFYETGTAEVVRMMRGSVQNMSILSFNSPGKQYFCAFLNFDVRYRFCVQYGRAVAVAHCECCRCRDGVCTRAIALRTC